jgi:predicted Zn-dependent protease
MPSTRFDCKEIIKVFKKAAGLFGSLLLCATFLAPPAFNQTLRSRKPLVSDFSSEPALAAIDVRINSGRLPEARERLSQEILLRGKTAQTVFLDAKLLLKERRFQQSIQRLQELLDNNLGTESEGKGSQLKSIAQLSRRTDPEINKLFGLNYVLLARLDLAEPYLTAAVQLAPEDYLAHFHLGLLYYTTSRFFASEQEFREVVKLRPGFSNGFDMLGLALEEVGNLEEAESSYRKAIELVERQKRLEDSPYLNLGKFLITRNRFAESVSPLERAIQLSSKSAEAPYFLGKALNKMGKGAEAVEALKKSVQNDTQYAEPHYLLSQIYRDKGNDSEAQKELQTFQELQTSLPRRKPLPVDTR